MAAVIAFEAVGYDPTKPIAKMRQYHLPYRTLSCWECFKAEGKMCHDKGHGSMVAATGSSNFGHAICCKPDYSEGPCSSGKGSGHVCSQPASVWETSDSYKPILTEGGMNYQMYAFCPKTDQKRCGIINQGQIAAQDDTKDPMRLEAGPIPFELSVSLSYREGRPAVRSYDACYYEIVAVSDEKLSQIQDVGEGLRIFIYISARKNTNVYIYGGSSRNTATTPIVNDNVQPETGYNYTANYTKGMLVIAFPEEDAEATLTFRYWVAGYTESWWTKLIKFLKARQNGVIALLGVLLLASLLTLFIYWQRNRQKAKVKNIEHVPDYLNKAVSGKDEGVELSEQSESRISSSRRIMNSRIISETGINSLDEEVFEDDHEDNRNPRWALHELESIDEDEEIPFEDVDAVKVYQQKKGQAISRYKPKRPGGKRWQRIFKLNILQSPDSSIIEPPPEDLNDPNATRVHHNIQAEREYNLQEQGLYLCLELISTEVIEKSIPRDCVFEYTAARLTQIGQEAERRKKEKSVKDRTMSIFDE